jgi:hypothetical protein
LLKGLVFFLRNISDFHLRASKFLDLELGSKPGIIIQIIHPLKIMEVNAMPLPLMPPNNPVNLSLLHPLVAEANEVIQSSLLFERVNPLVGYYWRIILLVEHESLYQNVLFHAAVLVKLQQLVWIFFWEKFQCGNDANK